jgi:hypothetical protein
MVLLGEVRTVVGLLRAGILLQLLESRNCQHDRTRRGTI